MPLILEQNLLVASTFGWSFEPFMLRLPDNFFGFSPANQPLLETMSCGRKATGIEEKVSIYYSYFLTALRSSRSVLKFNWTSGLNL